MIGARRIGGRLAEFVIVVIGVTFIIYATVWALPGDPIAALGGDRPLPANVVAQLRAQFHLDEPLWQQYLRYLGGLFSGDLGTTFSGVPVADRMASRWPVTITLALTAWVIEVVLGVALGLLSGLRRDSAIDRTVLFGTILATSIPVFVVAVTAQLVFGLQLGWFPTGGYGEWQNLVLPSVTLACFTTASIARLLRSSMLDVMRDDYVRTAYAKGLAPRRIYLWHVGRNSLIPVVTMTGILAGELLGGAAVTETVFAWPGVGRLIVQAIETKDFPVVQAGVAVVAAIFVLVNLLVDLLYGLIDPRIRQAS